MHGGALSGGQRRLTLDHPWRDLGTRARRGVVWRGGSWRGDVGCFADPLASVLFLPACVRTRTLSVKMFWILARPPAPARPPATVQVNRCGKQALWELADRMRGCHQVSGCLRLGWGARLVHRSIGISLTSLVRVCFCFVFDAFETSARAAMSFLAA